MAQSSVASVVGADRREQQRAGELRRNSDEDERRGGAKAGRGKRPCDPPQGSEPGQAEAAPRLLQPLLRLQQGTPDPDQRQRDEQDRIGDQQQRVALIKRRHRPDHQRDEGECEDDARHALGEEANPLEARDEPAMMARGQGRERQREQHGQCRAGEPSPIEFSVASMIAGRGDLGRRDRRGTALRQPIDDHAERHAQRDRVQPDEQRHPEGLGAASS